MRLSKAGNVVLSFPTQEEKEQAKSLMKMSPDKTKIFDMNDKMIPIWIKNIPVEASPNHVMDDLLTINPILEPLNDVIKNDPSKPYLKWVGSENKKKMRLLVPISIANYILQNGYLYTNLMRHPLSRMSNPPSRCRNCLRLHFHRAENCQNTKACEFCIAANHPAGDCPKKNHPEQYECITCKTHTFHNPPPEYESGAVLNHGAFDKSCLAWQDQFGYNTEQMTKLLKDAPGP